MRSHPTLLRPACLVVATVLVMAARGEDAQSASSPDDDRGGTDTGLEQVGSTEADPFGIRDGRTRNEAGELNRLDETAALACGDVERALTALDDGDAPGARAPSRRWGRHNYWPGNNDLSFDLRLE